MKIAKQSATILGIIIFSFFICANEQKPVSGTKTPASMVTGQNDLGARGETLRNVIGCDDCLLQPPMPPRAYRNLIDEVVSAIFACLKAIKPVL